MALRDIAGAAISAMLFLGGLTLAAPAFAAVVPITDNGCGDECATAIEEIMAADEKTIFPVLAEPIERFDDEGDSTCAASNGSEPAVHAVVLAPAYDFFPLPGTQNDAKLLRSLFEARGLPTANIQVLDGNEVTRERMIEAMRNVVHCVRERDQVILTFSGAATSYQKWRASSLEALRSVLKCDDDPVGDKQVAAFCAEEVDDTLTAQFETAIDDHNEHVLISSESTLSMIAFGRLEDDDRVTGLGAADLSNFATQIRNRGADVVFILDTNYAEDFRLLDQQQTAAFDTAWRWTRGFDVNPDEKSEDIVELFGSGAMAALYAASADEIAFEARRTGGLALGELTFAISESLHNLQNPTILQLSTEIDRTMEEKEVRQVPVFEATNPDMRFLATRLVPQSNPDDIEILEPTLKRGSLAPQVKQAKVSARYEGDGRAAFAAIDGVNLEIGEDGLFSRDINLGERTEIAIRVYGRDASLLSERRLLFGDDETEAQLPAVGKRVALVIANDTYADPNYPKLTTPVADGEALAKLLAEKFGYSTRLDLGGGKERDLLIKNATKSDIQKVLFDLRKRLTADDELLVYYAGHGEIDDEETAYWVPVDGEAGTDVTWIRAFDITDEMRRIPAGSVLLISDSCYAGGLSRGAERIKAEDTPRDKYLAAAARFKARQLISSGGVTPVSDSGGGGHSLFARALLDSLSSMPDTVFTASELFEGKLKPRALELAAAQRETQIPGYFRIAPAGDEPSSEYIFRRK